MIEICNNPLHVIALLIGTIGYIYAAMFIAGTAWYTSKLQYQRKLYDSMSAAPTRE